MKNTNKYVKQFYMPEGVTMDWMKKQYIEKPPIWCSVDLRDGNQALIIPMSLEEKLEFFKLLCKIGFKEIEVGFPAASDTEYEFCRTIIEQDLIPDDVTIQVLTQAREHIIAKTFEAIKGAKRAIVHLYNSTSVAQREQVFKKSKQEIIDIAVKGAKLCKKYRDEAAGEGKITFEYSPESFTGTEPEYAAEVCNAVLDVWQPTTENKAIINLPVTVEHSMPHVYGAQVEYMCKALKNRENVVVSLHPHNDRGTAVADSEMGLLAGGDRIEGTLFGNGERTGNVDIVTLALNMYSQGIDPQLELDDLPKITKVYERVTRMRVYERQPYSGQLVFAAFSGSHQDAIAKGMKCLEGRGAWTVPYLPIDPADVGREYEADVIRINSQSGKGGIGYVMETQFSFNLPPKMREAFGYHVKGISDREHRELQPKEIYEIFLRDFVNLNERLDVVKTAFAGEKKDEVLRGEVTVKLDGKETVVSSTGNGGLDVVSGAIKKVLGKDYLLENYTQHALEGKTTSKAASYVNVSYNGKVYWGVGVDSDIMTSSIKALVSAVNQILK